MISGLTLDVTGVRSGLFNVCKCDAAVLRLAALRNVPCQEDWDTVTRFAWILEKKAERHCVRGKSHVVSVSVSCGEQVAAGIQFFIVYTVLNA